jgi:transcriptional antiterminator RfaH
MPVSSSKSTTKSRIFWTVLATKFQQEQRALHHVERQGFEHYAPMTKSLVFAASSKTSSSPGSGTERREFLFPGYIFVRVSVGSADEPRSRWRSLNGTRGVARMFLHDELPVRVPDGELDYFRKLEDASGFVVLPSPIGTGSVVSILRGPLAGLRGVVAGMDTPARCRILTTLLGRSLETVQDRRSLALA